MNSIAMPLQASLTYPESVPLSQLVTLPATMPRILLVDDDPVFGKVMQRLAANFRSPLTFVSSVGSIGSTNATTPDQFDVAVIDYDLGAVTGLELVAYLAHQGIYMPVVLVSGARRSVPAEWADVIHEFVHKAAGPCAVLDAAFEAYELAKLHARIASGGSRRH